MTTGRLHTRLSVAFVFLAMVTLTACGTTHHNGVATLGNGHNTTTTTGSGTVSEAEEDQSEFDFVHCMRDHGVANMPDPVHRPGHQGLSLEIPDNSQDAMNACHGLLKGNIGQKTNAAYTPEYLDAELHFAQCMRQNGVANMPDPVPGQTDPEGVGSVLRDSPTFQQALPKCQQFLPGGGGNSGGSAGAGK